MEDDNYIVIYYVKKLVIWKNICSKKECIIFKYLKLNLSYGILGFIEKDTDELKGIFVDINFYFFMMIFVVVVFYVSYYFCVWEMLIEIFFFIEL